MSLKEYDSLSLWLIVIVNKKEQVIVLKNNLMIDNPSRKEVLITGLMMEF